MEVNCHSAKYDYTISICITFAQCRTNVEDVGPTLYKCYKMFCVCLLLGINPFF